MKKLEKLKIEREVVSFITLLPKSTKNMIDRFYESAIYGIENYGLDNDSVSPESLNGIKRILIKYLGKDDDDADKKAE